MVYSAIPMPHLYVDHTSCRISCLLWGTAGAKDLVVHVGDEELKALSGR